MWILQFLPDSIILAFCNILLLAGIIATAAGFFAHSIPFVSQYQLPFKIGGILLLVLGVYFRGGVAVETEWRERVAAVEAQLKIAEEKSTEANAQIDTQSQKKTTEIRQRMTYIRQYVDREVVRYNDQCSIPQPFIDTHHRAADAPPK